MFDPITLLLNADPLILSALREDITSEDVSTNCVLPEKTTGLPPLAKPVVSPAPALSRHFYLGRQLNSGCEIRPLLIRRARWHDLRSGHACPNAGCRPESLRLTSAPQ